MIIGIDNDQSITKIQQSTLAARAVTITKLTNGTVQLQPISLTIGPEDKKRITTI